MQAFLKFRPVDPDDALFLRELRAQVDVERLGLRDWVPGTEQLAHRLIDLQFQAHGAHYRRVKASRDTRDCIIELNGHPVGRFIVTQNAEEVYLSDIAVHPNFRGQGIGQAVIDTTKRECEQSRRLLHLHVDKQNTAMQFYLGLGFRVIGEVPTHFEMEWVPSSMVGKTMVLTPKGS